MKNRKYEVSENAIITTEAVTKTYENEDAHLYAVIEETTSNADRKADRKTYLVRTDMVVYNDYQLLELDNNFKPIVDDEGNPVLKEKREKLVFAELKQDWAKQVLTIEESDAYYDQLEAMMPEGLTTSQKDKLKLRIMFLRLRQADKPWGIDAAKWRMVEASDLDRVKKEII